MTREHAYNMIEEADDNILIYELIDKIFDSFESETSCGICGDCKFAEPIKYNKLVTKLIEEGKIIPSERIKCRNRDLIVYNKDFPKRFGCVNFEKEESNDN